MKTNITFRHMNSYENLQSAAEASAEKFVKYYDGITSTDIVFNNENDKIVEFQVRVNGTTLFAKEGTDDFMKSLNEATDKMIRQLKKWKTKINPNI